MKSIPLTPLTLAVARRAGPLHGVCDDLRAYVCDDDIREALDQAPPGIIDARSWAYWNSKMGRYPARPTIKTSRDVTAINLISG